MTKNNKLHALLWIGALAWAACTSHGTDDSVGGHTNWLPCSTLSECPEDHEPMAAACTSGYCVDAAGKRLQRTPSEQTGGQSAGQSAGAGAAAGGTGGTGESGASGTSAIDAGNPLDAGAIDAGPSGPRCGSIVCAVGEACCDHCNSACISALSGANCPDDNDPDRACGDAGIDAGTLADQVRIPECPGAMERCASSGCLADQPCVSCPAGKVCLELNLSCGPAGGSTAQCIDDPCAGATLDCACAGWACEAADPSGVLAYCSAFPQGQDPLNADESPFLMCSGGGICASPDTPIATPTGDVPIASLRAGDLVYSLHQGHVVAVPLLAVARTPVTHHSVVRLELDDGSVLEISAPHPIADGRTLGSLKVGETLDGLQIVDSTPIDYVHPYTYDVLPDSDSGTYRVHGAWLSSTL